MISIIRLSLLSLSLLLLTACVAGTRNIALEMPAQTTLKSGSGSIQIVGITDSRVFEQKPRSPRTPSAKQDVATLPAATKSTLIGRQRNGYGGAMGGVALSQGGTVEDEVRKLIGIGLQSQGYVLSENSDIKLDIDIDKFWAWMVPGFISVGFESEIMTTLSLTQGGTTKTVEVEGSGNNEGQIASNANWQLTYRRAFDNYLLNMSAALNELGL